MGRDTNAGRARHGGNSGRGGRGQGGRGRGASATVPRKASEVGACKDLEGHIFTSCPGNKGKDGDMLRTSMEKMATYIGTKYGNEAAQEWTSEKKITLSEPAYSQAIRDRHVARVKATRERIELRLKSLRGGPVHSFPPFIFFWRTPFSYFFCSGGNCEHPKTDRRRTKRGPLFAKMIIPPPLVAIFRLISSSAGRSIGKLATVSARTI